MGRIVYILLLVVHGLLHLLGALSLWNLADVFATAPASMLPLPEFLHAAAGFLWLLAFVFFAVTARALLMHREWWWKGALVAVLLSQCLIVMYWPVAKFGTILNLMLLAGIIPSCGRWRFHKRVAGEVEELMERRGQAREVLTEASIAALPAVVQRWLRSSQAIGLETARTVTLRQQGQLRTKPSGAWMPVKAQQYFTVNTPGFLWVADVQAAPFVHLFGRDRYLGGKGHMLIQLLGLLPVVNARGPQTDQGSLVRYMAETVWFPSAACSPYLTWEALDEASAKATMTYGGITATGTFTFNAAGDVQRFEALRYYTRQQGATLETWQVTMEENSLRTFGGVRIPTASSVTWKLKEGDFTWYRLEISDVVYNNYAPESTDAAAPAPPNHVKLKR